VTLVVEFEINFFLFSLREVNSIFIQLSPFLLPWKARSGIPLPSVLFPNIQLSSHQRSTSMMAALPALPSKTVSGVSG